ncbi:MAG: 5-(carboxyamino)imidazole ribonucleotide synthase [Firmicutes bacterium]|nr:5-(carboxyamino)imidazole ribonucleotide synthase [Bacillota bacterium]
MVNNIKTIGMVGGGQLGKMMILEAKKLGLRVVTLDPSESCPSSSISDEMVVSGFDERAGYEQLASKVDVITYEFEHINVEHLEALEKAGAKIYPSVASLKIIQDKLWQKEALREAGILVPKFLSVNSRAELLEYISEHKQPIMLKSRRGGYDGKGNALVKCVSCVDAGFDKLSGGDIGGVPNRELMLEELINFSRELSVIVTRGKDGSVVVYPIAENVHTDSILDTTTVPANKISGAVNKEIMRVARAVMDCFNGVGTFCAELFIDDKRGTVWVNEIAPRVHNSGHYTIEACRVSQFENHIRAIVGLGLGSTDLVVGGVIMKNIIGQENGKVKYTGVEEAYAKSSNVNVHIYGKGDVAKGRKMGHLTITGKSVKEVAGVLSGIKVEAVAE